MREVTATLAGAIQRGGASVELMREAVEACEGEYKTLGSGGVQDPARRREAARGQHGGAVQVHLALTPDWPRLGSTLEPEL